MLRFIRKEDKFLIMFIKIAKNIDEAAGLLQEMLGTFNDMSRYALSIKELEHRGDDLTHKLMVELNKTFITLLDREDIHDLSCSMDDIIDLIDSAAQKMVSFRIPRPIYAAYALSNIISEQTRDIVEAVSNLRDGARVLNLCRDIYRLEKEGDQTFRGAIARLFEMQKDPIKVIKEKELLETLELATDKCEDAANVLEGITLKSA